jgi:hypothetical protein
MDQEKEIRKIIRMLRETGRRASEGALTGAYSVGGATFVRQYNAMLEHLKEMGVLAGKLFPPLEGEVQSSEVGLLCAQLAAYLEGEIAEDEERPFPDWEHFPRPPHPPRPPRVPDINISGNFVDVRGLKDLGSLIRQHLPEWLRGPCERAEEEPQEESEEPAPEEKAELSLNDLESRLAELGARMQVLAERMRREDLSAEDRLRLADEMSQVGQEQGLLAREHARLRDTAGA